MNYDELAKAALDAGHAFMVVFHKPQENAETLWFTEYCNSLWEVDNARRFWRSKSRGRYSVKRVYDLKELNNA